MNQHVCVSVYSCTCFFVVGKTEIEVMCSDTISDMSRRCADKDQGKDTKIQQYSEILLQFKEVFYVTRIKL